MSSPEQLRAILAAKYLALQAAHRRLDAARSDVEAIRSEARELAIELGHALSAEDARLKEAAQ